MAWETGNKTFLDKICINFHWSCIFPVNSLTYASKEAVNSEQEATVYSEPGAGDTVNNDLGVTGPEFRWDYILIYSFLLFLKGCGGGGKVLLFYI